MIIKAVKSRPVRSLNRRRWMLYAAFLVVTLMIFLDSMSYPPKPPQTVNLVLALTKAQDYSWTSKLTIPNMKIIPFISDDPTALFHPPADKGREALAYLTYLYQFYDFLPDISIFVHGDDVTWHIDPIFGKSTANAIDLLYIQEALRRGYLNLRTSWKGGCPAWINTTNGYKGSTTDSFFSKSLRWNGTLSEKVEEPYMRAAFEENFPGIQAPEILAQPCCSQFAVSRKTIRSIPREKYQEKISWMLKTPLSDQLTGRMWEHMWQYLFLEKAEDCLVEYEALCRGWGICFMNQAELDEWNKLAEKIQGLKRITSSTDVEDRDIRALEENLNSRRMEALGRGRINRRN